MKVWTLLFLLFCLCVPLQAESVFTCFPVSTHAPFPSMPQAFWQSWVMVSNHSTTDTVIVTKLEFRDVLGGGGDGIDTPNYPIPPTRGWGKAINQFANGSGQIYVYLQKNPGVPVGVKCLMNVFDPLNPTKFDPIVSEGREVIAGAPAPQQPPGGVIGGK